MARSFRVEFACTGRAVSQGSRSSLKRSTILLDETFAFLVDLKFDHKHPRVQAEQVWAFHDKDAKKTLDFVPRQPISMNITFQHSVNEEKRVRSKAVVLGARNPSVA